MELTQYRDLATIFAAIVAAIALLKAVFEYVQQGRQSRAAAYFELSRAFEENEKFRELAQLLESDDPKIADVPMHTRMQFVSFHEEVALLLNSKLINEEVAHYMFGYYAIKCHESKHFWAGEEKSHPYWVLFADFVARMKGLEAKGAIGPRKIRF